MNFTVDQIKYTPFYIHEKKKTSRKLNGYHVYVSNAFKNFKDLGDEEKMELIRPALRGTILERLEESNVLQPDFDREMVIHSYWHHSLQVISSQISRKW